MAAFAADVGKHLSDIFARALDFAHEQTRFVSHVALGPFVARLGFADARQQSDWLPALTAGTGPSDFSIAFAQGRGGILGELAPAQPDQHVVVETADHIALWQPGPLPTLHLYDRQRRLGLVWAPDGEVHGWIRSRPLLPIIHAATLDTPWVPVHAAAVGLNGRFLALAGHAGAGKTTAALACAAAGWQYAGDDFVLVNADTSDVAPLYLSARTRASAHADLAGIIGETTVALTTMGDDVRNELRLADHTIGGRVAGGRIAAWLLPQRHGEAGIRFQPARASVAYQSLIMVTTMHLPFGRPPLSRKILSAIGKVPVYAVDTGVSPNAIPGAFESFLAGLPA